jgi:hypothetical protein
MKYKRIKQIGIPRDALGQRESLVGKAEVDRRDVADPDGPQ